MHAYTRYFIKAASNQEKLVEVLKNKITDVEIELNNDFITIDNTCDCVFEDDVRALAKEMARTLVPFEMTGTIDTSESAGELLDFVYKFESLALTEQMSDWYVEEYVGAFDGYEDFCESFFECSEEEYDKIKDLEFVYLIESAQGDVLMPEVPLGSPEKIEY